MGYLLTAILAFAAGWAACAGKSKVLAKLSKFFGTAKGVVDAEAAKEKETK